MREGRGENNVWLISSADDSRKHIGGHFRFEINALLGFQELFD